ncbi:MAG: hypothetical protein MJ137_07460 [Clostridia bacterium]|nr:hypothetical protein [Clostridia bacterium]
MKKLSALLLALVMMLCCFAACTSGEGDTTTAAAGTTAADVTTGADVTTEAAKVDPNAKDEGVLTYAEFMALETGKDCVIEAFVQAKYSYAEAYGNTSLYLADGDGAYYVYRWTCSADEYNAIPVGAKVKVTGVKADYKGEVEVSNVTALEVVGEDKYVADILDVTSKLASEDLVKDQNKFVAVKGAEIVASTLDGKEVGSLYSYNGSGSKGSDVYFKLKVGDGVYTYLVESDFCGVDTPVYAAAEGLKVGDKVDIEGFLYWYDGAQMQVTSITASK